MKLFVYQLIRLGDRNDLIHAFRHLDVGSLKLCLVADNAYDGDLRSFGKMRLEAFGFYQVFNFPNCLLGSIGFHNNNHISSLSLKVFRNSLSIIVIERVKVVNAFIR